MVGSVQETLPQQPATKRSAEADPEPSPVTKRTAEAPKPAENVQQSEQPSNAVAASDQPSNAVAASDQPSNAVAASDQPTTASAQETAAVNQSASADVKVPEHPPSRAPSGAETKGVKAAGTDVTDLAAVASKLVTEVNAVTAALQEAQKKSTLEAAAEDAPAEKKTSEQKASEPAAKDSSETAPAPAPATASAAPSQGSAKPTGADPPAETQPKDAATQPPAQPAAPKTTEAVAEKQAPEATKVDTNVNVDVKVPVLKPDALVQQNPPPTATLTPANPLPQTASTPLIGNVPPQAVESLKVPAQDAASVLPLQPTQETLAQQDVLRTTPLAQPVDLGLAPMEE